MEDIPLTPEELEKLVLLDGVLRGDTTKSKATLLESLTPELQGIAKTLRSLNKTSDTRESKTHIGMPHAIGRYVIRSVIGVGGYGAVYLAYDPQLRREVAVKVPMLGSTNDASRRQRFLNEVNAMAKLEHPNIVQVFDAGMEGDEVFLVLAYCPGPVLDEWLKALDRPVAPKLAATIIKILANAIEYSHRQGILHRDLKPGNILLFNAPDSEIPSFPYTPKIADFGLAKLLDENEKKTATSHLQGTPQYMPPEQLLQGKRKSTAAMDIYSLGVLLYRMLVGRTPFQFESIEEAVRKIEHEIPISPRVIQSNVPRDLSLITMKCLEKRPCDRYETAGELAADLDNFLHGRPIVARAPSTFTTARHWCHKHPLIAIMMTAATLFMTILGALEYRFATNLRKTNSALNQSRDQLLDRDRQLQTKVQELNSSLQTAEKQRIELEQRDTYSKQLIYAADVAAAYRAVSEQDPNRAKWILAPYFEKGNSQEKGTVTPEFTAKYLWSQLRPTSYSYPPDTQSLWAVAVSPDGKTVASAGSEGNIVLHDALTNKKESQRLRSEPVEINALAFNHDGKLLAAARDDGKVMIWDIATRKLTRTIQAIAGEAYSVRFLGKSLECAVVGRSNEIFIWNAESGELVRSLPLKLEKPFLECLEVSDDGSLLAVGGTDGYSYVVDSLGQEHFSFRTIGRPSVNAVYLLPNNLPDSYSLVVADKLGRLTLCKTNAENNLTLNVQDPIQTIAHLGEGLLLCGDNAGGLSLIEVQRNDSKSDFSGLKLLHRWAHHDGAIQSICIGLKSDQVNLYSNPSSRDDALSRRIYSSSRTGELFRTDLRGIQLRIPTNSKLKDLGIRHNCADIDEEGSLICQIAKSMIEWIDLKSGTRTSIETTRSELTSVARIPETDQWMIGNHDGEIAIVDKPTSTRDSSEIHWRSIFSQSEFAELAFHPNRRWYAARGGSVGFPLIIRDLATDEILYETNGCMSLAFSKDGLLMALGRRNSNQIEVIDITTWKLIATLKKHRSTINDLEFTEDGHFLVSCSDDRSACFWDTSNWELRDKVILPSITVVSMSISPDSRTLAISDLAGRITLWDMQTRRNLMELRSDGTPVLQVKFVANGSKMLAWNGRNEIEIYDTENHGNGN
jgi:serine/threonine protein kinase